MQASNPPTIDDIIQNQIPELTNQRRNVLRDQGLPNGFISVVDAARRQALVDLIKELGNNPLFAEMGFDRAIREHLETFGELYPPRLRDPDAFKDYLLKILSKGNTPGLPPLEGPSIDDILRGGGEGLGG